VLELKSSIKEDWALLPFITITFTGFIAAIVDFVFIQNLRLQFYSLAGILLLVIGGYLRYKARWELKNKAGFKSLASTGRLQVIERHRLVKDGLYSRIRHPIYLGETLRNFGFVLIPSSFYGMLLIMVATIFLLFRIEIEERMLIEVFGEEYREYQKKTKKMIPNIY